MSVKKDADGRRSVEISVVVPGTPEEVWHAIATGPGISSWFVPATVEERDGKPVAMTLSFGPGMDSRSEITAWNPPSMFAKAMKGWIPGSPPMANEWYVESRGDGTCTVRIVHSLFASTDDWDNQLEGTESGWPAFLATLRLYLTHFGGQRSALMQLMVPFKGTDSEAWDALTGALGLKGLSVGDSCRVTAAGSTLNGTAAYVTKKPYDALLRIDKPAPGIAALGVAAFPGGPTMVAMNFYLYGDNAAETVARETPIWREWVGALAPG